MRVENNGTRYFGFTELAASLGIKPATKTIKDRESQQKKFVSRHKCRACGEPMVWIGNNVMTCTNPKCRGIKRTRKNTDGTESVWYETSYDLLDEKGTEIAGNIFSAQG